MSLSISKEDAEDLLRRQRWRIYYLKFKKQVPPEFEPWRQQTLRIIKKIFGEKSDHAIQFDSITYFLKSRTPLTPESASREAYKEGLLKAEATIDSFIDELDLFPETPAQVCPKCHSPSVTFLEIGEVGSKKYSLAIPQIAEAQWQTGRKVAYYNCNSCKATFFSEPFKVLNDGRPGSVQKRKRGFRSFFP